MAKVAKNADAANNLSFRFLNASNFSDFLKRFIVVDSNALLELRTDNTLVIKSYTASRTAVKYGVLKLEDVFDFDPDEDKVESNIKIGIYNIERLIKTIAMYGEKDDVTIDFQYDLDSDGEFFAKNIHFDNGVLDMDFACAQKSLFKFMPDDIVKTVFNSEDYGFKFKLDSATLRIIESATALESGTDLNLVVRGEEDDYYLEFNSKIFKYKYTNEVEVEKTDDPVTISKDYLKYLDKETYTCYSTDNALLLFSDDSETKISFGRVVAED